MVVYARLLLFNIVIAHSVQVTPGVVPSNDMVVNKTVQSQPAASFIQEPAPHMMYSHENRLYFKTWLDGNSTTPTPFELIGLELLATTSSGTSFIIFSFGAIALCTLCCCCCCLSCLNAVVVMGIRNKGKDIVGVQVDVDSTNLNPCTGNFEICNLVVHNPDGFKSEHLMAVERIFVSVSMGELLSSAGKTVLVNKVWITGLDIIYEKSVTTSNVATLLDTLSAKSEEATQEASVETKDEEKETTGKDESSAKVTLHKLLVDDIGIKIAASVGSGTGVQLRSENIEYDDFSKSTSASSLNSVVTLLIQTVLESAIATIVGKGLASEVGSVVSGASYVASGAASLVLGGATGAANLLFGGSDPETDRPPPNESS